MLGRQNASPSVIQGHYDGSGSGKPALPSNQLRPGLREPSFMRPDKPIDHRPLAVPYGGHIDARIRRMQPKLGRPARLVCHAR